MVNYTIFRSSKILGEVGKQEILQKMFRKFQISNRLPKRYFPKIDVGCPCIGQGFKNCITRILPYFTKKVTSRSRSRTKEFKVKFPDLQLMRNNRCLHSLQPFFAGHRHFSLHFHPLSAFRGKRKKEFGRKHSERKPLTTTTTCVRRRVSN